jgi:hypothetical protein
MVKAGAPPNQDRRTIGESAFMKTKAAGAVLMLAAVVGILIFSFKKNIDTSSMQFFETSHFRFYFSSLAEGTKADMENILEKAHPGIQEFFRTDRGRKTVIVVYPDVESFQRAYLGYFLSLAYGDWAAGAMFEGQVLVASPENPGSEKSYGDILQILVHEYIHTWIVEINETPNIWLDEGLASYLAGQQSALPQVLPGFDVFQKDDLGIFMDNDGYAVGYSYLAYLDAAYGSGKIIQLIRTNDYNSTFGKSALEVYSEWVRYAESGRKQGTMVSSASESCQCHRPRPPAAGAIAMPSAPGPKDWRRYFRILQDRSDGNTLTNAK